MRRHAAHVNDDENYKTARNSRRIKCAIKHFAKPIIKVCTLCKQNRQNQFLPTRPTPDFNKLNKAF